MSILVLVSPDPQVWRLLRLDPGAESSFRQPVHGQECPCQSLEVEPLRPSNRLEDWLL